MFARPLTSRLAAAAVAVLLAAGCVTSARVVYYDDGMYCLEVSDGGKQGGDKYTTDCDEDRQALMLRNQGWVPHMKVNPEPTPAGPASVQGTSGGGQQN